MTPKIAVTATPSLPRNAPVLLRGSLGDAFHQADAFGCQGVEIHMRYAADVDLAAVKGLMRQYGLLVPTLGTGMAAADGLNFSDPEREIRERAVERVRGHIEFAAEVGSAVTIGSLSGRLGDCEGEQRSLRRRLALDCLDRVCSLARPLGVTVLLEPLNRYECDYINRLDDVAGIAQEIGAPNLKLLADTFHMNIEEASIPAALRRAGGLIGHVHLADTNREAPGRGHLDVDAVLEALRDVAYSGFLSFEVLPVPDPATAIRQGIATVHAAMPVEVS